jgi:hypothetical protein
MKRADACAGSSPWPKGAWGFRSPNEARHETLGVHGLVSQEVLGGKNGRRESNLDTSSGSTHLMKLRIASETQLQIRLNLTHDTQLQKVAYQSLNRPARPVPHLPNNALHRIQSIGVSGRFLLAICEEKSSPPLHPKTSYSAESVRDPRSETAYE